MLLSGLQSLRYLSVPMVTVFKNITTVLVSLSDVYFLHQRFSAQTTFSVLLMLSSSLVAAYNDLAFVLIGYAWQGFNVLVSAAYVVSFSCFRQRADPFARSYCGLRAREHQHSTQQRSTTTQRALSSCCLCFCSLAGLASCTNGQTSPHRLDGRLYSPQGLAQRCSLQ
jgi:hypothetical protein